MPRKQPEREPARFHPDASPAYGTYRVWADTRPTLSLELLVQDGTETSDPFVELRIGGKVFVDADSQRVGLGAGGASSTLTFVAMDAETQLQTLRDIRDALCGIILYAEQHGILPGAQR